MISSLGIRNGQWAADVAKRSLLGSSSQQALTYVVGAIYREIEGASIIDQDSSPNVQPGLLKASSEGAMSARLTGGAALRPSTSSARDRQLWEIS